MGDIIKDYLNSFLAIIVIFIGFIAVPEIRKKAINWIVAAVICCVLLFLGIDKINRDDKKDQLQQGKIDALENSNKSISSSLDILTVYIKRVDSLGIKRDSINNQPIITKHFINYIGKVGTLNQY